MRDQNEGSRPSNCVVHDADCAIAMNGRHACSCMQNVKHKVSEMIALLEVQKQKLIKHMEDNEHEQDQIA